MPAPDRGAVIALGARTLVLWGPLIPARAGGLFTRDGQPLALTVFRTDIAASLVDTITGNLRWAASDFPVTVID